jgi:polyhydroxyalkanoate synthase
VDEASVAAREATIGQAGVMHGRELAYTFSALRANDLIWNYVVNSYLKGKGPPAFDLLYWNSDGTNMAGPMYCWYVRNAYLENRLREPGGTTQCGVPVNFASIKQPAYVVATREDHIVPWRSAFASTRLLSGPIEFVLGASGHIAGIVNPAAKNRRNHWRNDRLGGSHDEWLESAESVLGSWWGHWSAWLSPHAGKRVPARAKLGGTVFSELEPAPGSYVKVRN